MNKYFYITTFIAALFSSGAIATVDCESSAPSCSDMNYKDTIADCPADYIVCPFDATLGKCIHPAEIGQIGYFRINPNGTTSDYAGWVFCDGRMLSMTQYPELGDFLGSTYGGNGSSVFAVPDYRNTYLRSYTSSGSSRLYQSPQGLPNLYTKWYSAFEDQDLTGAKYGAGAISTAVYDDVSGYLMECKGDPGNGYVVRNFSASNYSAIYGNTIDVRLRNTSLMAFIYAGKKTASASSSKSVPSSCVKGYYYYTDGTCSQTRNTSKTLKGIVSYVYTSTSAAYSYVTYIWGGGNFVSSYKNAESGCKSVRDSAYVYSPNSAAQLLASVSGLTTNVYPVYIISTSKTYWAGSTYGYTCSSTSTCSTSAAISSGGYYYCTATDYFY